LATKLSGALVRANDWLKTRFNNIDLFDEHHKEEAKTNPFYSLGAIFYLVWFIVMLTGVVLIMWYVPTKAQAFDSILNIQHHIPLGNLMRGCHKYGADAMIIAATMRLFRMFLAADYKPGKEFNIAIALITLLLSMYSGLTGYLLIWNQRAFWATKVFATFPTYMDQFPAMGDFYMPLVKSVHMGWNTAEFLLGAGGAITQETITRFFSLHLAFSLIPLIFVELYFYKTGYKRVPLNWIKRSVITGMLIIVSIIMPAALGHRSNPDVTPLPILSDWYFLGLYQMYKYLEPVVATEITLVIPLTVMLLPFIDVWVTGPEKNIWKRPLMLMTTIMGFVCWVVFSILIIVNIANIHNDPPYWRAFLWIMPNIGMLWQLAVYFAEPNPVIKAKFAFGAMTMAVIAGIQSALAIAYYYMALTELFFSPVTQSLTYWLLRPFVPNADKLEQLLRTIQPLSTYTASTYADTWQQTAKAVFLAKGTPDQKAAYDQLMQMLQQPTPFAPLDWLVKAIPTFDPNHLHYAGLTDFLVTNRWAYDYVIFCGRMNGEVKPYPLEVPPVDWFWMISGFVTMIACLWAWNKLRKVTVPATQTAAKPAAAAAPNPS
jgi:quinol-cytochrome oxidoreductase complex cytochrome b subunit